MSISSKCLNLNVKKELQSVRLIERNGVSYRATKVVEDRLILYCSYRFVGGIATAISVVCFPFLSPAFRKICLPYVPATRQQIKNVIRALDGRSGSLIDLGSGDGRIVLAAAKRGFKAHGIELNTWLIWYSRLQALINGLSNETAFLKQDLWKHHLGNYDNVVIFGVDQMMGDIEKKFNTELRRDSLVIACRFPLPNTRPVVTIGHGVDTVWVYKLPQR